MRTRNRARETLLAGLAVIVSCAAAAAAAHTLAASDTAATPREIREPAVAGAFYPADPARLRGAVAAFLSDAVPARSETPVAIVAPHAGYRYSGQIAADAWKQAAGHDYDLIVILGTNHTAPAFDGVSVYGGAGYRTPLGVAAVDVEAAAAVVARSPERFAWRPAVHEREHSVEVQVPFAQVLFPGVKILTAVVGRPDPALCATFGKTLASVVEGRRVLIVASSDLSHYPAYDDAVASDRAVLSALATLDAARFLDAIETELGRARPGQSTCACGRAPLLATIAAARALGAGHATVVSYANSGDTAIGDRSRVVGYGALSILRGPGKPDVSILERAPALPADEPLTDAEGKALLAFARKSIERWLATGTFPLARGFAPRACREQGAFVTLKKHGELRGCVGHREADQPLCQVVGSMALQAAFNDRRFRPVEAAELDDIEIEISLLTPFRRIGSTKEIELGRDGVYLVKDGRSAIYLPEVAVEQGWNLEQTMAHLCQKAGLPSDAWRSGAELYTFRSVLIHEHGGA